MTRPAIGTILAIAILSTPCAADPTLPAGDEFPAPLPLADAERDEILARATFVDQSESGRPQFNGILLTQLGIAPSLKLVVDNAEFLLSHPTELGAGRQLAVGVVSADGATEAHVFYRSNSQFAWRLCDCTVSRRRIDKGFHEYDVQLPIAVTVALLRLADKPVLLNDAFDDHRDQTQFQLASLLLDGLTEDRETGLKAGRVIRAGRGGYCSRHYAAHIPSHALPLATIGEYLSTESGVEVARPTTIELPDRRRLPDFDRPVVDFTYSHPLYKEVTGAESKLTGRVYESHDRSVRYLFFEDSEGRAVVSAVEVAGAPITSLGLRARYLGLAGIDVPLIEYGTQIPKNFGGNSRVEYQSNWPLVRELPLTQLYYSASGRTRPD